MKSSGAALIAPKCSAYSGAAPFRVNTVSGNSTKTPRFTHSQAMRSFLSEIFFLSFVLSLEFDYDMGETFTGR